MHIPRPSFSRFEIWWLAIRPRTLPAAIAAVTVGCALALHDGFFRPGPALAALALALLLQIGSNLANDVFDFERGVDTAARKGPLRVTQSGLLAPGEVKRAMRLVFAVALLLWLYLAWVTANAHILWLGLLAILAAIAYTGGPLPFGNLGLGDFMAFLFFGPAAVAGTYYVQALYISAGAWWMSILMGLIIAAILVVNNLRDIETDRAAGRATLAVRFGAKWARREYAACLLLAYGALPLLVWTKVVPAGALWSWASVLVAWPVWRIVRREEGRVLNKALTGTGLIALSYSLLFSTGIMLSG
jgi:1,4-dihydroxy-2-naphthoate octaprenyltransferase